MNETEKMVFKLQPMVEAIQKDLVKTLKGNKTAAQRVRTNSVKLEKEFKIFRKVSMVKLPRIRKSKKVQK